jgi:glycosyltransferase involved in cell wall biosynthesis
MIPEAAPSDICLILEGTYPYVSGGVSSWTHELIKMQSHLKFSLVTLVPANAPTAMLYELPPNVVSLKTLFLQELPEGQKLSSGEEKELCAKLEPSLRKLQSQATLGDLKELIDVLAPWRGRLGEQTLMKSGAIWDLLLHMYETTMPKTSFLDYFWSWRGLFGGLFSILLGDLPEAKVYHALCTGYAGLLLARAHLETGRPCLVTEHGIYTNERRIEITSADWIHDPHGFNLAITGRRHERDLRDLWIDTFCNYSRFCYEAANSIVTLYEGNQEFQRMDGANSEKMLVISNGIDFEYFASIERTEHPPTIALIGRVVPIKDIKTYIKAVQLLKQSIPDLRAYIMGPADEDPVYARECRALAEHLQLDGALIFTGKVSIRDYLGQVDAVVLTSISEAQPLVVLEAGAAGLPTVATDVGACREMILGSAREEPNLGPGGAVVGLGSPRAVADALRKLLGNQDYYASCSAAIRERVLIYYSKADQRKSYADMYQSLMDGSAPRSDAPAVEDRAVPVAEENNAAAQTYNDEEETVREETAA